MLQAGVEHFFHPVQFGAPGFLEVFEALIGSDSREPLTGIPTRTASVGTPTVLSVSCGPIHAWLKNLRNTLGGHLQGLPDGLQLHRELDRVALHLALVVDLRVAALHVHRNGERNVVPIHLAVFDR